MRILFCYNGLACSTRRHEAESPLDDVKHMATTHMSEVGPVLVCHWLRTLGHEITVLTEGPSAGLNHFQTVPAERAVSSDYDLLYIWKLHGLLMAQRHGLYERAWHSVAAWIDSRNPLAVVGAHRDRFDSIAWGTSELLEAEAGNFPEAEGIVVEHGTAFPERPVLAPAEPIGLYLGRLPPSYLREVEAASRYVQIKAHALWIQRTNGSKILLRPGQLTHEGIAKACEAVSDNVDLRVAVNVVEQATDLSRASFGLCSATGPRPNIQQQSASKFWDYLALGLPVVLADNTPEARHVQENPGLGVLYRQGDERSLSGAISEAMRRASMPNFAKARLAIQNWVFGAHTWQHRAQAIDRQIRRLA